MTDSIVFIPHIISAASSRPQIRNALLALLGVGETAPSTSSDPGIARLADTFSRFASTQQTAFDPGWQAGAASSAGTSLERQVERAFTQVLGRAPGRTADSFFGALGDTFPIGKDGAVVFTPTRSVVSLYSDSNGAQLDTGSAIRAGLSGQLSAEQAALYRQTSIVADDALQILATLQPFKPSADQDEVEALRALVDVEIRSLIDEFGRIGRPRPDRVESLFISLVGTEDGSPTSDLLITMGHLMMLGRAALLDRPQQILATSPADEAQQTNFELLRQYGLTLRRMWQAYDPANNTLDFTTRMEKARAMLPVVAGINKELMLAMDAVGFGEQARRSLAANFRDSLSTSPSGVAPELLPPNMTVFDLNEWIDRFTTIEAPTVLADSGQFGLDYVADQADSIFIMLANSILWIRAGDPSIHLLTRILLHERVNWALIDLLLQVKVLADAAEGALSLSID